MNQFNNDNIKTAANVRRFLHTRFYSNMNNITSLMNYINSNINPFTISYNPESRTINIKIKKTSIRKDNDFDNSAAWYYRIINPVMIKYFSDNMILIGADVDDNGEAYGIKYPDLKYIIDPNLITQIYSINICSNNIIICL